jgi:hypothetical protein
MYRKIEEWEYGGRGNPRMVLEVVLAETLPRKRGYRSGYIKVVVEACFPHFLDCIPN